MAALRAFIVDEETMLVPASTLGDDGGLAETWALVPSNSEEAQAWELFAEALPDEMLVVVVELRDRARNR